MEPDYSQRRREVRFVVEAGASVEICKNGQTLRAKTVNMSGNGVLLNFEEPVQLTVGDAVACEFQVAHEADKLLPFWGVGNVVRVDGCRAAIELKGGGFSSTEPEDEGDTTSEPEPGTRLSK